VNVKLVPSGRGFPEGSVKIPMIALPPRFLRMSNCWPLTGV